MEKDLKETWNINDTKENVLDQQLSDLTNILPKKSLSISKASFITFLVIGFITANFYFKSPNLNTPIATNYQVTNTDNIYLAFDILSEYEEFIEDDLFFMENIL